MRAKSTLPLLLLFAFLFVHCDEKEPSLLMAEVSSEPITTKPHPKEQAEIKEVLNDIFISIQTNDGDRLISHHAYGPKFTEFKDSEHRTGAAENEAYERALAAAVSSSDYELRDLKIAVFGKVAVVTFHADFRPTIDGNTSQINAQATLIFVKIKNNWKITHEHLSPLNM